MANLNDLDDVIISDPQTNDVIKYTADGSWKNAPEINLAPPGGNACGNNDNSGDGGSVDGPQTLNDKWTWNNAGCPSIEVKDSTSSTQICPEKTSIIRGSSRLRTEVRSDGTSQISSTGGQLYFNDSNTPNAVSLSALLAGGSGAGNSNGTFIPIIIQFELDPNNSQITNQSFREVNAYQQVYFGYPSGWSTNLFQNAPHRARDVLKSYRTPVTMPDGANAAIICWQGRTEFGVHDTNGLGADRSDRALALSHRLDVDYCTFPIGQNQGEATGEPGDFKRSISNSAKAVLNIPNNGTDVVNSYKHTDGWAKWDLITFTNNRQLVLTARCDVMKGGRGTFKTNCGRAVIYPFYLDPPGNANYKGDDPWNGPELGDPANVSTLNGGFSIPQPTDSIIYDGQGGGTFNTPMNADGTVDDDDYWRQVDALLDIDTPPETPAQTAFYDGLEYRNLIGRAINALDSRKSYPPQDVDSPATEAEYDAQIQALWTLADNATLETSEEFLQAFQVIYVEITKPKYGIGGLFQFEINAGVGSGSRQLIF